MDLQDCQHGPMGPVQLWQQHVRRRLGGQLRFPQVGLVQHGRDLEIASRRPIRVSCRWICQVEARRDRRAGADCIDRREEARRLLPSSGRREKRDEALDTACGSIQETGARGQAVKARRYRLALCHSGVNRTIDIFRREMYSFDRCGLDWGLFPGPELGEVRGCTGNCFILCVCF
jgi:hypothetical protein